jgi:hypothetical protein
MYGLLASLVRIELLLDAKPIFLFINQYISYLPHPLLRNIFSLQIFGGSVYNEIFAVNH